MFVLHKELKVSGSYTGVYMPLWLFNHGSSRVFYDCPPMSGHVSILFHGATCVTHSKQ